VIEYGSYFAMTLSALPCKIVGLELVGVLQMSFFSLGNMEKVNIMMTPLLSMQSVNGFKVDLGN
jgi:hypothetical protein